MVDSNYNRLLHKQEKRKTQEILFNRMRRFSRELVRNEAIMGMRNTTITLSNLIDSSCKIQGRIGVGERYNNSTDMEREGVVDSPNANYSTLEGAKGQLKCTQGRSVDEEEQTETTSGEDWDFLGRRGEKGEQVFKKCLLNIGLTGLSILEIIDGWHGSWKRHACSLTIFADYWAQQRGTVLQLSTLQQPYLTIANYKTYFKPLESDACIIQARNSISTLFELMGKSMISIRNKVIEQLMKEHVDRAAKVRKEIRYWKLSLFDQCCHYLFPHYQILLQQLIDSNVVEGRCYIQRAHPILFPKHRNSVSDVSHLKVFRNQFPIQCSIVQYSPPFSIRFGHKQLGLLLVVFEPYPHIAHLQYLLALWASPYCWFSLLDLYNPHHNSSLLSSTSFSSYWLYDVDEPCDSSSSDHGLRGYTGNAFTSVCTLVENPPRPRPRPPRHMP
ncbi:MAG: hypothetical protein EZS28_021147 [Streblomastix strix]|uniref:Uncharacterized protein n=1 Tax=Streblomastix strix TaxID=222440 RepID=A0A5J4VLM2_9EUKA|nr:MAG: hypothetical protein EZS28_021147 [Streblomastix strix]